MSLEPSNKEDMKWKENGDNLICDSDQRKKSQDNEEGRRRRRSLFHLNIAK